MQYLISTEHPERLEFNRSPETMAPGRLVSERAYINDAGNSVHGDRVIATNGSVSSINGYGLITGQMKEQFKSLQRSGATGNNYLDIVFADSASGKMVFIVAWDTMSNQSGVGGGLVVYDAAKGEVLSSVVTPYRMAASELIPGTPTVHLSPDGQAVVVEEYHWQKADAGNGTSIQQRFKTEQ